MCQLSIKKTSEYLTPSILYNSPKLKAKLSFLIEIYPLSSLSTFYVFIFFRPTAPIPDNPSTDHPWVKGIHYRLFIRFEKSRAFLRDRCLLPRKCSNREGRLLSIYLLEKGLHIFYDHGKSNSNLNFQL